MASPSSWRASYDSPYSVSSTFRTNIRRTHFVKFALDDHSSSSSRSKTKNNQSLQKPNSEKVVKPPNSLQISSSNASGFLVDESKGDKKPNLAPARVAFKFQSGKRPLWKRIFFASKKVRSIMLLNVIAVVFASSIPVVKEVEEIMDPALFTVVRFSVAAIPFLPFVLKARGDSQTRAAGIELGFWVSLGFLTQALGLLTSDAGRASFISAFTVVAVPLIDGMLGATVPALTWSGAVVSLIGVALLESSGSPPSVGDILNLLSAVFFGVHILWTEHISRVTKKENYLPLLGYEVCVVAIFSAIWYLFMGGFSDVQELGSVSWTWLTIFDSIVSFPWVPALYTGVFSTGLCLWVEMAAMCDVSATETAIIYGLEPLWGAAFAWFLLGERWGITGWIGAALILGGSLVVQIFGSAPGKSVKGIENVKGIEKVKESKQIEVSDRRNDISTSVVTVSSRDDVTKLWKK